MTPLACPKCGGTCLLGVASVMVQACQNGLATIWGQPVVPATKMKLRCNKYGCDWEGTFQEAKGRVSK